MKSIFSGFLLVFSLYANAQTVWINEIHYDNSGADVNEHIEVAGVAGTDLSGYSLLLINGTNGESYATISLSGIIDDEQNGLGTLSFQPSGSIQNGSPDGIVLRDPSDTWIQFLSYEGVIEIEGGLTSTDIGVIESSATTEIGQSLQLRGNGSGYSDFYWVANVSETPGSINENQTFYPLSLMDHSKIYFSIYPNPAKNTFFVESTLHIEQVEVYTILGQLAKRSYSHSSVAISDLDTGFYFVKVYFENNTTGTKKLFKE